MATTTGRERSMACGSTSWSTPAPAASRSRRRWPRLGLVGEESVRSSTAGGWTTGRVVRADLALEGGVRAERLRMVALPNLASPLLGMDVLGRLRWQQRDGALRIDL